MSVPVSRPWRPLRLVWQRSTGSVATSLHRPRFRVVVAMMHGAITQTTARRLERELMQAFARTELSRARVLLDLSCVTDVDGPGLDVLLAVRSRVVGLGGGFELLDPSAEVVHLLHHAAMGP